MTEDDRHLEKLTSDSPAGEVALLFRELAKLDNKGELGEAIAGRIETVSIYELAAMCAQIDRLNEMLYIPPSYWKAYNVSFIAMTFGAHRRILTMKSSGGFREMSDPIRDKALFVGFCEMIASASGEMVLIYPVHSAADEFIREHNYHTKFGALVMCFHMFVLDEPGHPVGMPFPGGFSVEARDGAYYCPVRDKEKDVKYSMCNFCPARQIPQ